MVETIKKSVGRRARELRKHAGFASADSAAEAMDVSPTSVYELERGDNWISPEMLVAMSAAYGVQPAEFFPGMDKKNEPTPAEALTVLAKAAGLEIQEIKPAKVISAKQLQSKKQSLQAVPAVPDNVLRAIAKMLKDPTGWPTLLTVLRGYGYKDESEEKEDLDSL